MHAECNMDPTLYNIQKPYRIRPRIDTNLSYFESKDIFDGGAGLNYTLKLLLNTLGSTFWDILVLIWTEIFHSKSKSVPRKGLRLPVFVKMTIPGITKISQNVLTKVFNGNIKV